MSKTVPNFLFPTNFRNGKNIKRLIKDFNVQGYGIAVYLLETLAETEEHQYPINDIDLLADEMKVSVAVINTVINAYGVFEIIEDRNGSLFISAQLNKWLEPYYKQVEQRRLAGKLSAAKRKQKQEEQLKQLEINLSKENSCQRPFNDRSTNKEKKKERSKESNFHDENEVSEYIQSWNENSAKRDFDKEKKKRKQEKRENNLYGLGEETKM